MKDSFEETLHALKQLNRDLTRLTRKPKPKKTEAEKTADVVALLIQRGHSIKEVREKVTAMTKQFPKQQAEAYMRDFEAAIQSMQAGRKV